MAIRKRSGKWYFRGSVPSRQPTGEIVKVRVERCLGTQSRTDALKRAADIERYFWKLAHEPPKPPGPTFAQAALTYIETRQKSDRFITKLIEHFGDTPLNEITQEKAVEAASKLYPGWNGSSLNRAVWTPLSAILRMSGIYYAGLQRPSGGQRGLNIPPDEWFNPVLGNSPPRLAALICFLTLTGRRVGEALALTEKDVNPDGTISISRTKTGVPVVVRLPNMCRDLLSGSMGLHTNSKRLFGYASLQAASVALRRTCERAGIPYYSFHKLGRHAFASRLLRKGYSTKFIAQAGGWQSMKSMSRYLHLEQSEVSAEVEALGQEWAKDRKIGSK